LRQGQFCIEVNFASKSILRQGKFCVKVNFALWSILRQGQFCVNVNLCQGQFCVMVNFATRSILRQGQFQRLYIEGLNENLLLQLTRITYIVTIVFRLTLDIRLSDN